MLFRSVFTNLSDYYDSPIQRPSFGLSNHFSLELQPFKRSKQPNAKITVKSRDLRTSNRLAMRTYLEEVDVKTLLDSKSTCKEKVEVFETIVKTSLDILAPKKAKAIHSNEPPWMNSKLKQLIAKRQRAFDEGDLDQYRNLRNRVNRERKLCHARFYESTVQQLKESKPATLWREVKKLSGMSSASGCPDPATLYQPIDCSQSTPSTLQDIANTISKAFLSPMNVLEPLAADSFPRPITEECPLNRNCLFLKRCYL